MNQKLKAVLLSLLVFPGAGQFLLKKYRLGSLLAGSAFVSLCVIMVNVLESSLLIAKQFQQGKMALDTTTISTALMQQQALSPSSNIVSIASTVLVLAWLISVIDIVISKS
jgi:hypothetical protein